MDVTQSLAAALPAQASRTCPCRTRMCLPVRSTAPHSSPCLPSSCLQVSLLRSELEGKGKQLQGLQADMKALQGDAEARLGGCEKQLLAFKERCSVLKQEVEAERQRGAKASANGGLRHVSWGCGGWEAPLAPGCWCGGINMCTAQADCQRTR